MSSQVSTQCRIHLPYRKAASKIACCLTIACTTSCNPPGKDRDSSRKAFEADTIAQVGHRNLVRTQVEPTNLKGLGDLGSFVSRWTNDALIAEAARGGLLDSARLRQVDRSVLARLVLERCYERAAKAGVPTDTELAKLSAERWFEVDRPAAAKTSHFVVQVKAGESPVAAQKLVRKIADAVRGIDHADTFVAAAKAIPTEGLQVTAESLPPMTADGRGLLLDQDGKPVGEGQRFDESFARAANALELVGSHSAVFRSPFGFHVILLERKIAAYQVPLEDRRRLFASEVYTRRARLLSDGIVDEGKNRRPVEIQPAFQEIIVKSQVLP